MQISLPGGGTVPLGEVADKKLTRGATTIRTENGQLAVHVYVDIVGRDLGGYVAEAQQAVANSVKLPPGYSVGWSGQFEYLQRAEARLVIVVPLMLALIILLLGIISPFFLLVRYARSWRRPERSHEFRYRAGSCE